MKFSVERKLSFSDRIFSELRTIVYQNLPSDILYKISYLKGSAHLYIKQLQGICTKIVLKLVFLWRKGGPPCFFLILIGTLMSEYHENISQANILSSSKIR